MQADLPKPCLPSRTNAQKPGLHATRPATFVAGCDQTPQALIALVRASVRRLLAHLPRSNAHDVDDLSQTVLVHLLGDDARVLRRWEPSRGASFETYITLVARRAAISALRRRANNPHREIPVDPDTLEDTEWLVAPDAELTERHGSRALLMHVQETLSPRARGVFDALYVDGLDVESARARLNMTEAALYAWRSRIKKHVARLAEAP
jgi:RNA polymerase sigma factor (sigma-70 family)